jgi:hypothetical protein
MKVTYTGHIVVTNPRKSFTDLTLQQGPEHLFCILLL